MLMHNPSYPVEVDRGKLIDSANLSVTEAANRLGVTSGSISNLINCHTGIRPEMAIRISIFLNTSNGMWLNLQKNYD